MTIHKLMNETNSSLYSYVAIERVLQPYEHVHWNVFYQSGDLPAPPWVLLTSAIYVMLIGILGAIGNGLLLWAFLCSSCLRTPSNLFIVNLAFSDLGISIASFPLFSASSYAGKWLFGSSGCNYYVASAGFFGFLSINTMAAVAIDRFGSITRWSRWYLTYRQVLVCICILWIFSLVLMMPPLFGWSRFILEGIQTSCTFDFFTRSIWSISYVLYLTVLGYILPVIVILVCYCLIVRHLVRHRSIMFNSGFAIYADAIAPRARTRTNSSLAGKRKVDHFSMNNDIRASITCGIIVGLFFLAWTPYAVVALIGVFGDQSRLTPIVNALPSLFAKSSAVFNPIVYAFMNNKFRQAILSLIGRQRHRTQRRQSPLTIYVPRQSPEQICLSQPRQSDLSLADLQTFSKSLRNSRKSTEGSIQTISPANLSSPLIPPIAEENSSNLAYFSISPQTIEASPFPGYFFEEVGPGLKYGKFHSPTPPDAYGEMKLLET